MTKQQKYKYSKKIYGGNGDNIRSLASIKANTQMILADIDNIEDSEQSSENCDLNEIKKNAIQNSIIIKNLIEDQQNIDVNKNNPLDQIITINGFTGTIYELLSKIREKIIHLTKYNNLGHDQSIIHLKNLLDSISSESVNVDKIKEILKGGRVKFKKNRIIFSKNKSKNKSKKIFTNKKIKKQTKRRR